MTDTAVAPSGAEPVPEGDPAAAATPSAGGADPSPARSPRFLVHLGLLVLVLAATLLIAKPNVSTWDEGSYGAQADSLRAGDWRYPWQFGDIDPDGRWFPIVNGSGSGQDWYPYARHPAHPMLQATLADAFGRDAGYLLPSVLGVLGAAACAWAVAKRLRPGTEAWALWLVASGPLIFHTTIIWAHAEGAALAGLAVLGAVLLRTGGRRWVSQLALCVGIAGVVLARSEGLLLSLGLLAALGLDTLLPRSGASDDRGVESDDRGVWWRRIPSAVFAVGPAFAVLVATWLFERRWVASIMGPTASDLRVRSLNPEYSWAEGRMAGLWSSTLSGNDLDERAAFLPILLLVIVALVLARRQVGTTRALAGALGLYALIMVLFQLTQPAVLTGGLLPAWPLMVVGVAAAGSALWRSHRLVSMTVVLTALAIWGTQYPDGGVFQWGGRFFMVLAAPLAVLAADGVRRLVQEDRNDAEATGRPAALFGVIVALALVCAIAPLVGLRNTRGQMEAALGVVDRAATPLDRTETPLMVTTSEELPRLMWRSDIEWLRVPANELDEALPALRDRGIDEISLVAKDSVWAANDSYYPEVVSRTEVPGTGLYVYTLRLGE